MRPAPFSILTVFFRTPYLGKKEVDLGLSEQLVRLPKLGTQRSLEILEDDAQILDIIGLVVKQFLFFLN